MQGKNPYYLHQQNQLNQFSKQNKKPQQPSPTQIYSNANDEFAIDHNQPFQQPVRYQANNNPVFYQIPQPTTQSYYSMAQHPFFPQAPAYQTYMQYPVQNVEYQQNDVSFYNYQNSNERYSMSLKNIHHCPFCNKMTRSISQQKLNWIGWIVCCILCLFTLVFCWIPWCFEDCKQKKMKCSQCKRTKFLIKP